MPQGGVDEGEGVQEAAIRELEEEVGTRNVKVIKESSDWYYYDLPNDLVPKIWKGQYRGQKQKWFLMKLLGNDSDINIHTDEPEFCDWQWVSYKMVPELIVSFKQDLYRNLVQEFGQLIEVGE